MQCNKCGSFRVVKRGSRNGLQRVHCKDCHTYSTISNESNKFKFEVNLEPGKYVITSAQNNIAVNEQFYRSLQFYCYRNNAKLIVLPITVNASKFPGDTLQYNVQEDHLVKHKFSINGIVNVLSNISISPHADNPISGLESLSKGKTLIIPHTQVQLKSLPVSRNSNPVIIATTGTITYGEYRTGKSGQKAEFNHTFSAIALDFKDGVFHLRHLNCDDNNGFFDIDGYYTEDRWEPIDRVEAIITGDEHVYVMDEKIKNATYTNIDSIVNTLKPKYIVRHDVLDCFTVSHHHKKDSFLQYLKHLKNMNRVEDELNKTAKFIIDSTPSDSITYIISSNHNDHLKRWLNECDPKTEVWNLKLYHYLSYLMVNKMEEKQDEPFYIPDPFRLFFETSYSKISNVKFTSRNESLKIMNIEVSNHGDIGANGTRGSISQYAKFNEKNIIGHSHTPGIMKGAYQVGASTSKNLEYTNGPSSWMNTHCIIYPNGKRQLINIIDGKWC